MSDLGWVKIGLIKAKDDCYAAWADEILDYSGLPYSKIEDFSQLASCDVIVLFGYGRLSPSETLAIKKWIDLGGRLIACGSTWGFDESLGVKDVGLPSYSKTKLVRPSYNDRLWPEGCPSVVFYGGQRVGPAGARIVSRTPCGHPAITRYDRCFFIAPHLGQTVATLSMGRSVETDGIGPGDGSVVLEDGVRRAEDGTNLCFTTDRTLPQGCSIPIFETAHVDILREVLYRAMFEAVEASGRPAYAIWRWPDNSIVTSTVTIDCDSDDDERVMHLHRTLENHGQKAAWLVTPPGFSSDVYRKLRGWGDSVGLLYQVSDPDKAQEAIKHQSMQITRAAGVTNLSVARPVDGGWRGLKAPYSLAEQIGAGLSVAKGGVQPGSSGFTFGTSCPFFPVFPEGRRSTVAELPYSICRPGVVTEAKACQALIAAAARVNGCVHSSLSLRLAHKQEFGLIDVLRQAREQKFGMYSPEELLNYERARRSLNFDASPSQLRLGSPLDVRGLTLMVFGGGHEAITCNRRYPSVAVRRHGTLVSTFVLNLEAKAPAALRFERTMAA